MILVYLTALVAAVSGAAIQQCCGPSKYSAVMLHVGGSHKGSDAKIEDVSGQMFIIFFVAFLSNSRKLEQRTVQLKTNGTTYFIILIILKFELCGLTIWS